MLIANEQTYASLATFESIDQLNGSIQKHRNSHNLTATELVVLDVLAQYSCKYPGVSFLTKNSIADQIGKSRRTIIRVCHRLEELGIIEQHEVKRSKDMQQTSNAIVIKPWSNEDVTQDVSHHEAPKPLKQKTTKLTDTINVPSEALRNSLPMEIFEAFDRYYEADDIYEYYGTLLRAKRRINPDLLIEHCPSPFVEAIHAVVHKAKRGEVRNLANYFYVAFESAAAVASRLLADDVGEGVGWLGG